MGDTVTDILQTRLDLANLSGYEAGMGAAGTANLKFGNTISTVAGLMAGAGGIAASFGFVKDATRAAAAEQATYERSVRNFKGGFPIEDMEAWAGQMSDLTAIDDGVIAGMAGVAGSFGLTADQAKMLVAATLNAKESLKELGGGPIELQNAVTRAAVTGSAGNLTRMGLPLDEVKFKAASLADRLTMLQTLLNSQGGPNAAAAWAQTAEGRLAAYGVAVGNLQEDFGKLGADMAGFAAGAAKKVIDTFLAAPEPLKTTAYVIGILLPAGLGVLSIASSIATIRQAGLTKSLIEETLAMNAATTAAGKLAVAQGAVGATGGGAGKGRFGNFVGGAKVAGSVGAADFALQFVPDDAGDGAGRAAKNIANRAFQGASLGMFAGPRGAAVGATLGGIYGAGENLLGGGKKDDVARALETIAANTAKTAANTDPSKLPLSTSDMPGARQQAVRLKDILA